MYNLFLDDERVPYAPHGGTEDAYNYTQNLDYVNLDWVIVRSYEEFVKYIETHGLPQRVSFDHDLSDFNKDVEMTGYDCCKWLCEFCIDNDKKLPNYLVHTQNPIGKQNILSYIKNCKKYFNI